MEDPLGVLRTLAKSNYYQTIYGSCKETGLKIFENTTDLTFIQLWFLSFLSIYSVLNMDVAIGDAPEKVLEDVIYEDAYLHFKKKSGQKDYKKKQDQLKNPQRISKNKNEVETAPKSKWLFKRAKD